MGNRDRVKHNPKRKPEHTLKEKRAEKRAHREEAAGSAKHRRRAAAAHERHGDGPTTR